MPQVLCPHPRAKKCTIEAARIVRDAAVAAGAPPSESSRVRGPCKGCCVCALACEPPGLFRRFACFLLCTFSNTVPRLPMTHILNLRLPSLADIISWIEEPSMLASQALMTSRDISLILATGGPQMVRGRAGTGARGYICTHRTL